MDPHVFFTERSANDNRKVSRASAPADDPTWQFAAGDPAPMRWPRGSPSDNLGSMARFMLTLLAGLIGTGMVMRA